ncbi:uncharacterized protein LOC144359435 [Saccoglossus kowalevskii]
MAASKTAPRNQLTEYEKWRDTGCHLTWSELKGKDTLILQRCRDDLAKIVERREECDFVTLPSRSASLLNLQGFLYFKLDDMELALNRFETVLDHDPRNHNALANLAVIYKEQGQLNKHRQITKRLERIISENYQYDSWNELIARSLVDRGHAIRFFEQDKREFSYMKYFQEACRLGEMCDTPERAEWFFDYALALYRVDVQLVFCEASTDLLERSFRQAATLLYDITKIDAPSVRNRALSWVFLGILINNVEGRSLSVGIPDAPETHMLTAADCLKQGLDLSKSPYVTRRVAAEYTRMKQYDLAMEYFDLSLLELDSWFAHRHRGLLFLAMNIDEYQYKQMTPNDLLEEAEKSFKIAIQRKDVHADHSDLGFIHAKRHNYTKAIMCYRRAVQCEQDDYCDPAITYKRWGLCLMQTEEYDGAREKLEESMRKEKELKQLTHTSLETVALNTSHYDYINMTVAVMPGDANSISPISEYRIKREHPLRPRRGSAPRRSNFVFDFFLLFSDKDREWALGLLSKLEWDCNLTGCVDSLDSIPGEAIADNFVKLVEASYKTIVILTPHFEKSGWCKYGLEQAHWVHVNKRKNLVPIMVHDCDVPSVLRGLSFIECNLGLISRDSWGTLLRNLREP